MGLSSFGQLGDVGGDPSRVSNLAAERRRQKVLSAEALPALPARRKSVSGKHMAKKQQDENLD
jgi:hypothetical protein